MHRITHLPRRKHAPSIGCFDKELTLVIMALLSGVINNLSPVNSSSSLPPCVRANGSRLAGVCLLLGGSLSCDVAPFFFFLLQLSLFFYYYYYSSVIPVVSALLSSASGV